GPADGAALGGLLRAGHRHGAALVVVDGRGRGPVVVGLDHGHVGAGELRAGHGAGARAVLRAHLGALGAAVARGGEALGGGEADRAAAAPGGVRVAADDVGVEPRLLRGGLDRVGVGGDAGRGRELLRRGLLALQGGDDHGVLLDVGVPAGDAVGQLGALAVQVGDQLLQVVLAVLDDLGLGAGGFDLLGGGVVGDGHGQRAALDVEPAAAVPLAQRGAELGVGAPGLGLGGDELGGLGLGQSEVALHGLQQLVGELRLGAGDRLRRDAG